MDNRKKQAQFIFIILIINLSLITNSNMYNRLNTTETPFSDMSFSEKNNLDTSDILNYKEVNVDSSQDLDENGFQDTFECKLLKSVENQHFDCIVSFKQPLSQKDEEFLRENDIEIIKKYQVIDAYHIKGKAYNLLNLRNLDNIHYLEENVESHSLLFDATIQIEARRVWASNQNYDYQGNPNTAIAILDTGIDDTHTDTSFNIAYWQDFIGADASISGDEYATPTDKGEHGTHCAAIAASSGDFPIGEFHFQDSGRFPIDEGYAYYGSWFYMYRDDRSIDIDYSWEGGGTPFVGILDDQSNWIWHNYNTPDSSSPASYHVTIPTSGWYVVMWGNKAGAGGHYYSGEVAYLDDWWYSYETVQGPFSGVAPESKVVGLKVLDDTGSGSGTSLLDALDWLYLYGQDYGVTVASMSLGFSSIVYSVDSAITSLVRNKGIVCVVAAGNSGTSSGDIFSPGSSPDCIAVGAVNKEDEIAYYSSNGDPSASYLRPDVVAPGGSLAPSGSSAPRQPIFAADSNDADSTRVVGEAPRTDYYLNNFRGMQGTSMACPMVAGLAQLVIDAMIDRYGQWEYSWENAKKVKQIICMGTFEVRNIEGNLATGGESYNGDGDGIVQNALISRYTKDHVEGWGRVSAEAAVQAVTKWLNEGDTITISLDGKNWRYDLYQVPEYGHHVEIRQIDLLAGIDYQLSCVISESADIDVLFFKNEPTEYGDPDLLFACVESSGSLELKTFKVPSDNCYYVVIRWVDGNYIGSCELSIKQVVILRNPENNSLLKSGTIVDVDIQSTYMSSFLYNWDDTSNQTWTNPYQTNVPIGDGLHTLNIYAQDITGHWITVVFTFFVDDTGPIISLISHENNSFCRANSLVEIAIYDDNLDSVYYKWDNDINISWSSPYTTYTPMEDGLHILSVYANDSLGEYTIMNYHLITDETSPTYSDLTQSKDNPEYNETNIVSVTISEPTDASGVDTILLYYRVDSGSWIIVDVSLSSSYTFFAGQLIYNQLYDWYFWFNDSVGNQGQTAIQSFTVIDSYAPEYTALSQTTPTPEYNETNTISILVSEPLDASGIETILLYYRVDGGSWTIVDISLTSDYAFTADQLFFGQLYEWYIWFNDTAGNNKQTPIESFTVIDSFSSDYLNVLQTDSTPNYDDSNTVSILVSEPFDASGVDMILLYYRINSGSWIIVDVSLSSSYTFVAGQLIYDQLCEWYFWFNDSVGNNDQTSIHSFTVIDSYSPDCSSITQTNPTPEYNESNTVSISVVEPLDASGVDTILFYYRVDGGSWIIVDVSLTSSYTFTADQLIYGQMYDWYFWFNDTVGNNDQTVIGIFTVIDSYDPEYTTLSQTNLTPEYNESNTVSISVFEPLDASGVDTILLYYRVDGGVWVVIDVTLTSDYTFTTEQLEYSQYYEWHFWFNDTAGNARQTSIESFFVDDTLAPNLLILSPENNTVTDQTTIVLEWAGDDDGSGIAYYKVLLNDEIIYQGADNVLELILIDSGFYNLTVQAFDIAGNNKVLNVFLTIEITVIPELSIENIALAILLIITSVSILRNLKNRKKSKEK